MKVLLQMTLLLVLGVAAFEGYVWYKVRATVSESLEAIAPFVQVDYGSVVSSIFPREVGLDNLSIRAQGDELHLEHVRLHVDSVWDLFALEQGADALFERGATLTVKGLDLTESYGQLLDSSAGGSAQSPAGNVCAPGQPVSSDALSRMGYRNILADLSLEIAPAGIRGPGPVRFSGQLRGMTEFSTEVDFLSGFDQPGLMAAQALQLDFNTLSMSVRDLGFNSQWLKLCAELRQMTPELFVEAHQLELQEWLAHTYSLGLKPAMFEAYRAYLLDGSRVRIELAPKMANLFEQMQEYSAEGFAELLGLKVFIDGRQITEAVGFIAMDAVPVQSAADTGSDERVALEVTVLSWPELADVARTVVIETHDGEVFRGRIAHWNTRRVMVEKRVAGGKFTVPVLFRDFKSARALSE